MNNTHKLALKVSVALWIVWGLVHVFAGGITLSRDPSSGFAGIADAIEPSLLAAEYHPAVGGLLNQHGWNLLWIGTVTLIGALFIWRANMTAIWVTAMVGGLADVGYFLFLDIPGYVNFIPGTVMTIFSTTAIVLSFWVWFLQRNK
ncbi:MAG: hypothetical protein AB8B63_02230 [Granulosicoccus sp.]